MANTNLVQKLHLVAPLVVLIVPHGTTYRTGTPEGIFLGFMFLVLVGSLAYSATVNRSFSISAEYSGGLYAALTLYVCFANPIISVGRGNDFRIIFQTAIPFLMLGAYYLLALVRLRGNQLISLVDSVALSGVAFAGYMIYEFIVATGFDLSGRFAGMENRAFSLPILTMSAVIVTTYAAMAADRGKARLWTACLVLLLGAIFITVTRALLLSYLVGFGSAYVLLRSSLSLKERRRIRRRIAGLIGLAVIIALPFLGEWINRLSSSEGDPIQTALGRIDEYKAFTGAFLESPVFGAGIGARISQESWHDLTLAEVGITLCHSHFFFFIGTTGVVGVLLYNWVILDALKKLARRRLEAAGDPPFQAIYFGMFGAVIAGYTFTLTSTTYSILSYNLAIAVAYYLATTKYRVR